MPGRAPSALPGSSDPGGISSNQRARSSLAYDRARHATQRHAIRLP
ncbi:MAG: hypothetical protein JNL08_19515 [Planctomycetes bacterium]|nr:hypothetical protein [Planctomycetota bacterium]